ncbi:MAG TPA: tRNA (adenosine(37)-N6)-threonylcarbamoyltransferase complex dimerization subunit type 1 TsaB [Crocinitomicaceae bacterium]|nr:tRNA (adenosine(37)-N6)-threonylcarbamoyltransferase complex dimerization subunit type 1 TsaB [Crocinitomicaceae bacterium]
MKIYILHLETATKVCSVALSENGQLMALKEIEEDGYSHGENLNLFIQDVCNEAQIKLKDLNAVSLASGPGSYTGLRIGAATAKSLCYALDIPLIAIDALTSLKELAKEKYSTTNLCAVIDARRMEVYNAFFNSEGKQIKEISADIIDENSYEEYTPFVCFGDGADKLKEVWKDKDCTIDASIKSSAKGQVKIAYNKLVNKDFEDVAYWEPFYLKDFIAGKKKK